MEVIDSKKARDIAAILPEQRHQQNAVKLNAFHDSLFILSDMVSEGVIFFQFILGNYMQISY